MDFNEDKLRLEINKSKVNPNAGLSIEDQLKSAFDGIDKPQVKAKSIPKPAAIKTSPKPAAIKASSKPAATKATPKPAVIKASPKPVAIKATTKPAPIKATEFNRIIPLSTDIRKLIYRDNSGETLSVRDYFRKVIRFNETVTLGHVLAEEGKVFTDKSILNNYGDSCNSVAHAMALCKVKQESFMFTDKEILMLVGAGGNSVAHLIAASGNIERMSFTDIEIFGMRNDKGESVANLLAAKGIKFTNKAFNPIRKEIFKIIAV
ncbi:MAG: hypothetical protein V7785_00580 [Bermanella sp.]